MDRRARVRFAAQPGSLRRRAARLATAPVAIETEPRRRRRTPEKVTMDEYVPKPYPGATPGPIRGLPGLT